MAVEHGPSLFHESRRVRYWPQCRLEQFRVRLVYILRIFCTCKSCQHNDQTDNQFQVRARKSILLLLVWSTDFTLIFRVTLMKTPGMEIETICSRLASCLRSLNFNCYFTIKVTVFRYFRTNFRRLFRTITLCTAWILLTATYMRLTHCFWVHYKAWRRSLRIALLSALLTKALGRSEGFHINRVYIFILLSS